MGAVLTALALGMAVAGAAFFASPRGQEVFTVNQERIGLHRDWGSFLGQRQAVWRYGQDMWGARPVTGVGIGQFASEAPRYRAPERQVGAGMDRKNVNYTHNDALQIAADLGSVGLVLFAALLLLPLVGKANGIASLASWGAVPALLFSGIYDAHATAIPGTSVFILALLGFAAWRVTAPRETH